MTDHTDSAAVSDADGHLHPTDPARRSMLRRSAVAGAAVWATPAVVGLASGSAAVPSGPPTVPTFRVPLDGGQEVPPVTGPGTGEAVVTVDGDVICVVMDVDQLTGPPTAAHIHGPAPAGANAGVQMGLGAPNDGPTSWDVCAANGPLAAAIVADPQLYYLNVHTVANPGGEVRGQLA